MLEWQGYDISFLITNFHTETMYKHKVAYIKDSIRCSEEKARGNQIMNDSNSTVASRSEIN